MLEENFQHVSKVSSHCFTAPIFIFHFLLKTCLVLSAHVETRVPLWFCLKIHILPTVFFSLGISWCLLLLLNSQVWSHIYFIEIDKTLKSMAYSSLSHGYMFVLAITSFNLGIKRKGSAHLGGTYAKIRIIQRLACPLQRWCKFVIHFIFSHQYEKMHHTSLGNWKFFLKWDCFQDIDIRITKIQNTVTSNAGKCGATEKI